MKFVNDIGTRFPGRGIDNGAIIQRIAAISPQVTMFFVDIIFLVIISSKSLLYYNDYTDYTHKF